MNYSGYASIHARHIPEKVCLIERTPATGERRTFTWKEFNNEINRTANYLAKELFRLKRRKLHYTIITYCVGLIDSQVCRRHQRHYTVTP